MVMDSFEIEIEEEGDETVEEKEAKKVRFMDARELEKSLHKKAVTSANAPAKAAAKAANAAAKAAANAAEKAAKAAAFAAAAADSLSMTEGMEG